MGSNQVLARFARNRRTRWPRRCPLPPWAGARATRRSATAWLPCCAARRSEETEAEAWLPQLSMRNGQLALEHGLHQEIGWERRTDASGMAVLVFADHIDNPVMEAMGDSGAAEAALSGPALLDNGSGLVRVAGPDFSSAGMMASFERRLPGGNQIRLSYANGNALVMAAPQRSGPASIAELVTAAHPRRAQMYALSLSGTLEGTGTRWRASYRWQPEDTVSQVAPFAEDADLPYMNLHVRQPIHLGRDGSSGLEALLDVRNLLAQGYRPYVLSDGSLLVFAQDQRSIRGGAGVQLLRLSPASNSVLNSIGSARGLRPR